MKTGKIIKRISIAVAALAVSGAVVWGAGYWWSRRAPGAPTDVKLFLAPERVASPGSPAVAELTFRLPLCRRVKSATAEPGKNSVLSGAVEVASKWRWSYRIWRVRAVVRPLASGRCAPGKLALEFAPPTGEDSAPAVFEIPAFEVEAAAAEPDAKAPLLAGAETPRRSRLRLLHLLWLVIPAALLCFWLYRCRRGQLAAREVPPWERARAALLELRSEVASGHVSPVSGVERLTDVVRRYLEERFYFPASRLTTPEFLVKVAASPELAASERAFLREFMTGADLVKFARVPAAASALDDAIGKAEQLVERTVPRENDDKTASEVKA